MTLMIKLLIRLSSFRINKEQMKKIRSQLQQIKRDLSQLTRDIMPTKNPNKLLNKPIKMFS